MPQNHQPFNKYNELGAYHYNATIGAASPRLFNPRLFARYDTGVKVLEPKRGDVVVDAGSGEGVASFLTCQLGGKVIAIELEPEACRLGEKLRNERGISPENLRFTRQNLYALELPDASVNGIVSLEVIEHMSDVGQYLKELERILVPGGRIVLTTPLKQPSGLQDPYHIREFAPHELTEVVNTVFVNVKTYSAWAGWKNAWYESNGALLPLSKMKRGIVKLFAYLGWNFFTGPAIFDPRCPLLLTVAEKRK